MSGSQVRCVLLHAFMDTQSSISSTGISGNASTEDAHLPTSGSVSGSSTSVNTTTSEGMDGEVLVVGVGGVRFVFCLFVLRVADTRAVIVVILPSRSRLGWTFLPTEGWRKDRAARRALNSDSESRLCSGMYICYSFHSFLSSCRRNFVCRWMNIPERRME
jgi:hypothetical protein